MKTYSNNPPPKPGVSEENVARFQSNLADADTLRADRLSGLHELRTAKLKSTVRELSHAATKHGEDHPIVVRLKAEVAAGQRINRQLGAEVDRANVPAQAVTERGWVFHGFVRNRDLQGLADLTVALFDSSNCWIEKFGHTCTGNRGYFRLCFIGGKEPATKQLGEVGEVFVRVSDAKRQELYCDKKPMSVVLGQVRYREIIIGGDTAVCPPPCDTSSPKPPPNELPPEKPTTRKAGAKKKAPKKAKA
jgi:hypothetical protein